MNFVVEFRRQDFSHMLAIPNVQYMVNRYSHSVYGGPVSASVSVRGPAAALQDMLETLRSPVEIRDDQGTVVWWGYVWKATIRIGRQELSVSLGSMANRITASISYEESGTDAMSQQDLTWIQDDESVSYFGTKERRFSYSDTDPIAGAARLIKDLELLKYPGLVVGLSGAEDSLSAILECRGWWDTLNWKYYLQLSGEEGYTDTGDGTQNVGTSASQQVFQASNPTDADTWLADAVFVRARKGGDPTDSLRVHLTDGARNSLAYGDIAASSLSDSLAWIRVPLSTRVPIVSGSLYGVLVARTGALNSTNYYTVDIVVPPTYAGGVFTYYDGAWKTRDPDGDMPFRITGVMETTLQLYKALLAGGQFFTGVDIEDASALYTNPKRDGGLTSAAEAKYLLDTGTSANRRLFAQVTPERRVRVYLEPVSNSYDYLVDRDWRFRTVLNEVLQQHTCPYGVWVRMSDILPTTLDTSRLSDYSLMFVDGYEYDVVAGRATPILRNQRSLRNIGDVEQG